MNIPLKWIMCLLSIRNEFVTLIRSVGVCKPVIYLTKKTLVNNSSP